MDKDYLIDCAIKASKNSYSPYSNFKVGASLLTGSDMVYLGANIENMSYSATICAERVAVFNAVSAGDTDLVAMCVYHSGKEMPIPCGMCLQVLSEFVVSDDFLIIVANDYKVEEYTLQQLLPVKFNGGLNV